MEEVEDMSILQEKEPPLPPQKNKKNEVIRGRYLQERRERCVLHDMVKNRWGNREGIIYSTKKKNLRAKCKDVETPPLPFQQRPARESDVVLIKWPQNARKLW
jgi:hypothetical protein